MLGPQVQRRQEKRIGTTLVLAVTLLPALAIIVTAADPTVFASLPTVRAGASAVLVESGCTMYVFGGLVGGGYSDKIVKVGLCEDPVVVSNMSATLPTARAHTSACFDGTRYIYIVGGEGSGGEIDDILQWDLQNTAASPAEVQAHAVAFSKTSTACAAGAVYIFGGSDGTNCLTDIYKYDPILDQESDVGNFPSNQVRCNTSAVTVSTDIFVYGGKTSASASSGCTDNVSKFTPGTNAISNVGESLPTARFGTSAALVGSYVYVFGGHDCSSQIDKIARHTYSGLSPTINDDVNNDNLPSARHATAAVAAGSSAYIVGGILSGGSYSADILKYTP